MAIQRCHYLCSVPLSQMLSQNSPLSLAAGLMILSLPAISQVLGYRASSHLVLAREGVDTSMYSPFHELCAI